MDLDLEQLELERDDPNAMVELNIVGDKCGESDPREDPSGAVVGVSSSSAPLALEAIPADSIRLRVTVRGGEAMTIVRKKTLTVQELVTSFQEKDETLTAQDSDGFILGMDLDLEQLELESDDPNAMVELNIVEDTW